MHIGRFRLGMRTIKSSLAVMICILIFHLFNRGEPLIACLSAVFSLRQDLTTTFSFGKSRVLGNSIGALIALGYLLLQQYFQNNFWIELLVLPLLVAFMIVFSDGINNNAGIISGIAAMLLIIFSVPPGESALFAFERVFDTFIGMLVAMLVNFVLRPPKPEVEKAIQKDLSLLKATEANLKKNLAIIQNQIQSEEQTTKKK